MDFSVGMGQKSNLSLILTRLYIAPAIHNVAPVSKMIDLSVNGVIMKVKTA